MLRFFYFQTSGRCGRQVYWLAGFLPFLVIGLFVGLALVAAHASDDTVLYVTAGANVLFLWPVLAMQAKRWHDLGFSGWMSLLMFIPYLGLLIALVIGFLPGKAADNRYGPNPYEKINEQIAA